MATERIQRRIDRLLDQIEEEADQLNWPAVLDRAKAVLAYDPENEDAGSFLTAAERALEGAPTPISHWLVNDYVRNVQLFQPVGDWESARRYSDLGLALSPHEFRLLRERVVLEFQLGDLDQASSYLDRFLDTWNQTSPVPTADYSSAIAVITTIARITGDLTGLDIAEAAAQTLLSSPFTTLSISVTLRGGLGLLAFLRDDAASARDQYASLEPHRGTMLRGGLGSCDHVLALIARTKGDLDQAATHFYEAREFCLNAGYRPQLAWICCDYSDALRARDAEGDRTKAMSLLDESLAISSELGMRPLVGRVLSRR